VAIGGIAWVANIVVFSRGRSSLLCYSLQNLGNDIQMRYCIRYRAGECGPQYFGPSRLIHLQLRSEWEPTLRECIVLNSESSKLYIIIVVFTDIVLLITMLVGLFRWRRDGGVRFGIGGFLWKQVR
jgi:hypothetical protein